VFECKAEKDPRKFVKSITMTDKIQIYHLADYEGDENYKLFLETIDNLSKAQNMGKAITYKFDYSNFTFDLWIILHRTATNLHCNSREQYLKLINSAFSRNFITMKEYKHEDSFKSILNTLTLQDVKNAVTNAKNIMKINEQNGYDLLNYKKYQYYKENPSTMVWEAVEKILSDCSL
jgi:hypothetical protein